MNRILLIKIIILGLVIAAAGVVTTFYIFQPKKTVSPISSKSSENRAVTVEDKQPSKTLKTYTGDSGFSFKYPEDVSVDTKENTDDNTYSHLELTSNKTAGNISIKITDTKFKTIEDWLSTTKIDPLFASIRDIKIGNLSGRDYVMGNKITAVALDQNILFTIEVSHQGGYDYWFNIYETILSSFEFVQGQSAPISENAPADVPSDDVIVEEEIVE